MPSGGAARANRALIKNFVDEEVEQPVCLLDGQLDGADLPFGLGAVAVSERHSNQAPKIVGVDPRLNHDLGADWHRRRNDQAHTRRLVAQLETP